MLKRLIMVSLAVLLIAGFAWAEDGLHLLEPTRVTVGSPNGPELDEANFFISRTSDATAEYYLGSGAIGDTMCVHFQPLAPCEIYFAEIQWFNDGPYQAFVWEYAAEAADIYTDGRSPERGTSEVSPLGTALFGPFTTSAEGTQDWEYMFTQDDLLNGEPIYLEDGRPFIVGFVKTAGEQPQPLADDVSSRGFTYTWFGGPWMADYDYPWGSYSSDFTGTIVDVMMRVGVDYPLGAPPIIAGMNQLPNTLDGNKTCQVSAEIIDDNGWDGDEALLFYQKNDDTPMSVMMTDDDSDDMFMGEFTIDAAVGDVIKYWIEATDDEDQVNSNEDNLLFFEVKDIAKADADILVIDHGSEFQTQLLYSLYDEYYFAFWDVDAEKGIDESVTTLNDWGAIYVFGWGSSSVPTRDYTGNAYVPYLQNEGNLFFADQDYFYGNAEDAEPEFAAGDFAYDVFGIAGGMNDPYGDPLEADTSFFGEFDDPISGAFADDPFITYFGDEDRPNNVWTDDVDPIAEATVAFIGEMNGAVNGIYYENGWGGKTVYLAFDATMAIDRSMGNPDDWRMTDQFMTLMNNVNTWFGATSAPEPVVSAPLEFSLAQNYPNPFNPSTQISFTLPTTSDVTLVVYNTAGQQVASLVNGQMNAGQQSVTFDASSLASGVYFYTLQAGELSATKKMMLLK